MAGACGTSLGLKQGGSPHLEGFLAHGQVLVVVAGIEADSPQVRRCITNSAQGGTIRQGSPVVVSLNGRAVGGGDLSVGQFERETLTRGDGEPQYSSCLYTFNAPVVDPGEGEYVVEIGSAKAPFSMEDLRNGVILRLTG